jgi:hypothetical protein
MSDMRMQRTGSAAMIIDNAFIILTMRMKWIFIIIMFLLSSGIRAQNQIMVAQKTGTNIHYTDFQPDSSVQLINGGEGFQLDIDNDGFNDLAFYVLAETDGVSYTKFWSSITTINDKVKILSDSGNYNFVLNLNPGDTISAYQNWSTVYDSTYDLIVNFISYYPPPGSNNTYGYLGYGYLGFQIEYPSETFFGWIRVMATSTSIIVAEVAISGVSVKVEKFDDLDQALEVYPNPCHSDLHLKIESAQIQDMYFEIVNTLGEIVKKGEVTSCISKINIRDLQSGFYLLNIRKRNRLVNRIKFIKN